VSTPSIVVAGAVAHRPQRGGHAWVFLQYLLGFRRLGFDVLFVDRLEPDMCVTADGALVPPESSPQLAHLEQTMSGFDVPFAVLTGHDVIGMSRDALAGALGRSSLLLDVMGYLGDEELTRTAPSSVFLDIDPGFGQMWCETGLADLYGRHDLYATVGGNVGRPECSVPTCGVDWVTTRPPVVLGEWPAQDSPGRSITSVATWRGPFAPVEYEGETYGLRVHEFRRFLELPERTNQPYVLALDIDAADVPDRDALTAHRWDLVDPVVAAGDTGSYRRWVQGSMAELGVAKSMYVQTKSGWLSDRSACYLASGRPAIVQDTGLSDLVPTGNGLLTFSDVEEAVEAVARVARDPEHHATAARQLAETHFSSDVVLPELLDAIGVDWPARVARVGAR
jgi:hypothetical protein